MPFAAQRAICTTIQFYIVFPIMAIPFFVKNMKKCCDGDQIINICLYTKETRIVCVLLCGGGAEYSDAGMRRGWEIFRSRRSFSADVHFLKKRLDKRGNSGYNNFCNRGCSSSGRAPPCQGGGSEFEPRHPLQLRKVVRRDGFFRARRIFRLEPLPSPPCAARMNWNRRSEVSA